MQPNYGSRGEFPIIKDSKLGDLVEVILSHPHDGDSRYAGYIAEITSSALSLSLDHHSNQDGSHGVLGPLSLQMITEYRIIPSEED